MAVDRGRLAQKCLILQFVAKDFDDEKSTYYTDFGGGHDAVTCFVV